MKGYIAVLAFLQAAVAAVGMAGCDGANPPITGDAESDTTSDVPPADTGHDTATDTWHDTSSPCDPPCEGGTASCCAGVCVDVNSDMSNCGYCGAACNPDRADKCIGGSCTCRGYTQCSSTQRCCPEVGCRTVASDPTNCGECGNACPSGNTCVEGECLCGGVACDPGMGCCSGSCRDLASDEASCGTCGNVCTSTAPECVGGTCTCDGDPPCTMCGFFACSMLTPPGPYEECQICCPGRGCVAMSDTDCGMCGTDCSGEARCEPVMGTFTCTFQCLIPGADASTDAGVGG